MFVLAERLLKVSTCRRVPTDAAAVTATASPDEPPLINLRLRTESEAQPVEVLAEPCTRAGLVESYSPRLRPRTVTEAPPVPGLFPGITEDRVTELNEKASEIVRGFRPSETIDATIAAAVTGLVAKDILATTVVSVCHCVANGAVRPSRTLNPMDAPTTVTLVAAVLGELARTSEEGRGALNDKRLTDELAAPPATVKARMRPPGCWTLGALRTMAVAANQRDAL
mmetsp:Transcript_6092/g.13896  ORF Transcript_6092/g.13896 Transcript_6092/m.13896 type:complete len:226 (-) Transcript_6092:601-1278(-)